MNLDKAPLPRFWYLPRGEEAAVVMTGDDHANGGTVGQFDRFKSQSPASCTVADWECMRATSYVYPNTPITDAQATGLPGRRLRDRPAHQHELRQLHAGRRCETLLTSQLAAFAAQLAEPGRAQDQPHALHRLERLGDTPLESSSPTASGFDTNYYYWPGKLGPGPPGACSPARASRSASPTSTAR